LKTGSQAHWHFAASETHFELFDKDATLFKAETTRAEQFEHKQVRESNKKRLSELIATRGIADGMYVQNNGVLQKWIGKVLKVDGTTVKVRLTYVSSAAPRGFLEGKEASFKSDEIKAIEGLSVDAILQGYK